MRGTLVSAVIMVAVLLAGLLLPLSTPVVPAYGHGMGKETVGPKDVNGRSISLDIKIEPELRKVGELVDMTFTMKAIDASTKEIIPGTIVYDIAVAKFGTQDVQLRDRFHIMPDQDTLKIIFKPDPEAKEVTIEGETMPNMGYMRTEDGRDIVVRGPVLVDAGLYIFTIDLVGIGDGFLSRPVQYVSYLTISEQGSWKVEYDGKTRDMEYISYFEKVKDLKLFTDSDGNIVVEAVSDFDWSPEFVKDIPLLHFEYYIPKDQFPDWVNREMKGYINGMDASVFVDRAAEGYIVVHYMIIKSRLVKMAEMVSEDERDRVIYTLVVGRLMEDTGVKPGEGEGEVGKRLEWAEAMVLKGEKGRYIAEIRYAPVQPNIDEPTAFQIRIFRADDNEAVSVPYRLLIYNQDRVIVDDLVADGKDTLEYGITEGGSYAVVLNINDDEDRVVFGLNVVPEFPLGIAGVLITAMIAVSLLARHRAHMMIR
ncbi:MAG: hypothetical protein RMJ59_03265 [Candidatus Nitrosocaldus sp.]|nr:hypothetical protein [Candidatus Nitrosocaldus sp.]MCS7140953.1 hypothetical protein [Candidatus Nitrosocaldus sp.]MDW7999970.1 hypothetical protein [Candidatus Nitrosocaldus sp.]MDW8275388.1 hypothetical protein [Candidatus Nitrosocaldus sp.]